MLTALLFCVGAGMCTGIGGLFCLFRPNKTAVSFSLGFAAGVMMSVALIDMIPHAVSNYVVSLGNGKAALLVSFFVLLGGFIGYLLDKVLPDKNSSLFSDKEHKLFLHTAFVTAVAVVLHNLPEGILTLLSGIPGETFNPALALAVALHNLPEGIAIAVPIAYVTGKKLFAVTVAFAAGLAEPLGALPAIFLLSKGVGGVALSGLIATISGIMLFVAVAELFGTAVKTGGQRSAVPGVFVGVVIMVTAIFTMNT